MTKVAGSSGFGASTEAGGYKMPVVPASANGAGKGGSVSGNAASNGARMTKNGAQVPAAVASTSTTAIASSSSPPSSSAAAVSSATKQHTTLFEPTSARSWEKSRIFDGGKGPAGPSTPTQAELNAQLRPEGEEELIPLHAIAGRMVQYAWQLFANQVEINPSISPLERRKRIYEDAHEARKQLIKLLVLVQWSKSAPELQMARNLIGLINGHIYQSMAAIESISDTRSMLSNARLRNYDLITAIEVLSRGGPQSIPASFKQFVQPQDSYTDAEAIALVAKLDDVLRLRLASEEMLAVPMLSYTINDGRASFVAHQLFEADLTLSGSSPEDRWWLLRVKFDFRVTGAGAERFPRQLRGQQRLNLLELADGELAPRSVATAATEREVGHGVDDAGGGMAANEQVLLNSLADDSNVTLGFRKDAPLVRLYNLLQSQSLHYRLDILHWQAVQLVRLSWHQRLMVFFDATRVLHLRYWRKSRETQEGPGDEWDPCSSADICISVTESEPRQGAVDMIKSLFEKFDDRGHKPVILEVAAHWDVRGVACDFLDSRDIPIDHHALDAHALLLDVVQRHAKAAILAFRARIESSPLSKTMKLDTQSRSVDSIEEHTLLITVHERLTVVLSIDRLSGQVKLEERSSASPSLCNDELSCATLASLTRLNYVRDASKAINERPRTVVGVLQRLRCQILLDDLEEKCALAGLACTKRMPLRQADYAQLQATPATLLFVAMQQCPSYYLVLHVGDDSIQVALMCAGTFLEETITSMRIVSLERLDWTHVLRSCLRDGSNSGKRKFDVEGKVRLLEQSSVTISEDDLAALHSYSVALICYHKVEEQLRQRGIPYIHVGGLTDRPVHDWIDCKKETERHQSADDYVSAIVPSLRIDSRSLLGTSSESFTGRNLLLRLRRWTDPRRCRVEMAMRVKLQSDIVTRNRVVDGSDEVLYDAQSGVLTFAIANVDNCFGRFLTSWQRIEKVLGLVRVLGRQQRGVSHQDGGASSVTRADFALNAFDMTHVAFKYAGIMSARVGWVQDMRRPKQGYFALAFSTTAKAMAVEVDAPPSSNPHNVMRQTLQEALNQGDENKPLFWPTFLNLLQRTLPVAQAVYDLPEQCLRDIREPELEVKCANWIRLTFLDRFTLDVRLLQGERVLFHAAGQSMSLSSSSTKAEDGNAVQASPDDPFILSMLQSAQVTFKHSVDWTAIPSFETIARNVANAVSSEEQLTDQQKQRPLFMTFPDALLYKGDPVHVQSILQQLKHRIASAVEELSL